MSDRSRSSWLVVAASLALAGVTFWAEGADVAEVGPGARIELEFPNLPSSLAGGVSRIVAVLPTTYDPSKTYPLCLWLEGGSGGDGSPRTDLCDPEKYICIGMPLFRDIGSRKRKSKNKAPPVSGAALHVQYDDAEVIWPAYKAMIEKLASVVPNIAKGKGILGGFSNGAHCIGVLLTEEGASVREWFGAFILAEGGYTLQPKRSTLNGCAVVVLAGESSWAVTPFGIDGSRSWTGEEMAKKIKDKGAKTLYIKMKGVGHAFPNEYVAESRRFLESNGF